MLSGWGRFFRLVVKGMVTTGGPFS
jgi:hypothetical protein